MVDWEELGKDGRNSGSASWLVACGWIGGKSDVL